MGGVSEGLLQKDLEVRLGEFVLEKEHCQLANE